MQSLSQSVERFADSATSIMRKTAAQLRNVVDGGQRGGVGSAPKPLKSPVSRSVAKRTCWIVPHWLKSSVTFSSSTDQARLPRKHVRQPA